MNNRINRVLALLAVIAGLGGQALAGVTGKISGIVTNATDNAPLVGATIRVVGTNLATKTDEDGEYFIIGVPVGEYNVSITHVGFETILRAGVRVLVDLTTPVNFRVKTVAVHLDRQTVVHADAPVIQRDLTASRVIFTSDKLKGLPNIESIQSILSYYPGVITDRRDSLHVRGGRGGQISYYLDGYTVQDPFVSQAGMRIMPTSLEELSITSGGFSPEYGQALSGVVNAVTREGGSTYRGGFRTYQGGTHAYDISSAKWQSLQFNQNRSIGFNLSGPIPKLPGEKNTFFAAAEYLRDFGSLPHDWKKNVTATTKLSLQPTSHLKVRSNFSYSNLNSALYRHRDQNGRSYDFNLDGLPVETAEAYLAGISANYLPNERSVWSLSVNRFSTYTFKRPQRLRDQHWSQWPGYSEDSSGNYNGSIHENYRPDYADEYELTGYMLAPKYNPIYWYRSSVNNTVAATWIQQLSKSNQVKAGLEYNRYHVRNDSKQFYNENPYGEFYDSKPVGLSGYAQTKLEYAQFVINAGLRYDYFDPAISYNATWYDTVATFKKSDSRSSISPRFGVSFPISEKSVMHANYGVYYQTPVFRYMYMNLAGNITSGLPLLGNPDLKPERTVAYELGVDQLINENVRFDVTAYYKDISNLVATREAQRIGTTTITKFTNDDYGTASGFDISIEKLRLNGLVGGSISYGYLLARGIGSTPMESYYTYVTSTQDTLAPVTEYPLEFDQRHTMTTVFNVRFPADWKGHLFGLPVPGGWGLTFVGYLGSGLPYTKTDAKGNRVGARNEGRLPARSSVDMRFNKDLKLGKLGNMLTVFVEVDNLFDRRNVLSVYSRTGLPNNDNIQNTSLSLDADLLKQLDGLYDHDPQNYSRPRTMRLGLEYSF